MLMTIMQWVCADYVLQNMNLVEKIKIIRYSIVQRSAKAWEAGKFKKLFLFRTTKEKEIQLSFLKMRNECKIDRIPTLNAVLQRMVR
jgi:hypothetical protein